MGQASTKLRRASNAYFWFCPACDSLHPLPDGWSFDGNVHQPTFSPSFKHDWGKSPPMICHYIVTAGKVNYCGDCTHALAGQTIDMPDLPEEYRDFEAPAT